ncbi:DUF86 domain-containing protein [Cyanobium sp. HWJ4-Hawea]|uniref:HepT-like ribonuclease domain-containing protein n=1 Tax=Cyanobium sp. HWJ4-Hawea TaxID=2823713 RepID=UPI0020CC3636|nr:DUF86 domain-containing protein [Cyanobium sp. HWJ4-Hawea]MCP9809151.1 DUF86 domain-containing protein [Cyanobium sp. HWJ4-Hawea]
MEGFASRAISYCAGLSQNDFEGNPLVQDAVLRNIELIGEAATRIPPEVRESNPGIAWRQIVAMRNQLIHGYLGIDLEIVWDVVTVELPALLEQCQKLRRERH